MNVAFEFNSFRFCFDENNFFNTIQSHMFGFTKRFFVIFANSLQLKSAKPGHCSGTCSLTGTSNDEKTQFLFDKIKKVEFRL